MAPVPVELKLLIRISRFLSEQGQVVNHLQVVSARWRRFKGRDIARSQGNDCAHIATRRNSYQASARDARSRATGPAQQIAKYFLSLSKIARAAVNRTRILQKQVKKVPPDLLISAPRLGNPDRPPTQVSYGEDSPSRSGRTVQDRKPTVIVPELRLGGLCPPPEAPLKTNHASMIGYFHSPSFITVSLLYHYSLPQPAHVLMLCCQPFSAR